MSDVPRFSDGRPVPDSDGTETQVHFENVPGLVYLDEVFQHDDRSQQKDAA